MEFDARQNVIELTAILSAVSLALVFGAVLGVIPDAVLPRASKPVIAAIPHVNAVVSLGAIVAIGAGVHFARRGAIDRHRVAMLSGLGLFGVFLILYLYRVALVGPAAFPGPESVRQFVYLPLLSIHVVLAVICVPLLFYVALIGLTHPIEAIPETRHPTVGRIAALLWAISFALGLVVYVTLYLVY